MKILILKPSSLGDVIQALPVARLLRRHFAGATIHWWLNRDLVPLLEGDPDIARIIPFDRKLWANPLGLPEVLRTIRSLRGERYDWVIDLQSLARSAAVAWVSRGARTIGLDDRREGAPALYDVAIPRKSADTHAVDWYLDAVRHLGAAVHWDFEWIPLRRSLETSVRARWFADSTRWIALQPGARWLNKRWPVASFAELATSLLASQPNRRIAILGSPADAELARAVVAATRDSRVINLCGELSLPEMVEFLRSCALMITNDTGPMHVAVAVKTPVIGLFGPTNPYRTGPYGQLQHVLRAELPCAPCLKSACEHSRPLECLHQIRPVQVAAAAEARLNLRT